MPLIFSLSFRQSSATVTVIWGFFAFSLLASIIYVVNDLQDRAKDRNHPVKCRRPLASGAISPRQARYVLVILTVLLIAIFAALCWRELDAQRAVFAGGLLVLYAALNLAYSAGLKNVPLVEVTILAAGYILRVWFGSELIGTEVSVWLYLLITVGAFYLGLGKRRNEIARQTGDTRAVLKFYTPAFLDKNMYMCQCLCVVFYALWSVAPETVARLHTGAFLYTVPLVLLIFFKYSLNVEQDADGDPTSIILSDGWLAALCGVYALCAGGIIFWLTF